MNFPHSTKNAVRKDTQGGGKFIFGAATTTSGGANNGQFGVDRALSGAQGGTPSSRGVNMHAHTNITSRENFVENSCADNHDGTASLHIGPGYTGRTFQSNLITSPTGGGSQRQPINAVLGQHVDDDEPVPDEQVVRTSEVNNQKSALAAQTRALDIEEVRSVSTLYGANLGKPVAVSGV